MATRKQTREPLQDVADFIRLVRSRLSTDEQVHDEGIWFSRRDEGSLFLDAEETRAYSGVVTQLEKQYVPREDLSRRSVEAFLQEALFVALDLQSRSSSAFEERLGVALDRLLKKLKAPSKTFRCWVPVEGLDLEQSAPRFGGITFAKYGRHQLRQLVARQHRRGDPNLKQIRNSNIWGSVCAIVDVSARDSASAETLALRLTRQTLDVLNVFTDLVPYNSGWLYLPGETAPGLRVVPMQSRGADYFNVSHTRLEPFALMSWKSLRATRYIAAPLRNLDRIAKTDRATDTCATILLSGTQWAGRATVDRRREQSFLLYAIALETMLLPTTETQGLGHRLRLRVAHLLGRTMAARERIAKEMGRLYGIRSKIVHAGSYEVTDADLGSLRSIVKGTLFRLVLTPRIHSMNRRQLSEWLDRKLLR